MKVNEKKILMRRGSEISKGILRKVLVQTKSRKTPEILRKNTSNSPEAVQKCSRNRSIKYV